MWARALTLLNDRIHPPFSIRRRTCHPRNISYRTNIFSRYSNIVTYFLSYFSITHYITYVRI